MSFFTNDTTQPRDDNSEPFLDALVSMTSNDSGVYVGVHALRNSDVFTAVRVIASDLATNPIEYNDKRISGLLNKAPNDHMTAWSFKFALVANMLLNGNSFARVTKNLADKSPASSLFQTAKWWSSKTIRPALSATRIRPRMVAHSV